MPPEGADEQKQNETSTLDSSQDNCETSDSANTENANFFRYLKERELEYETELVENFLLSLKAKPFVILSGGSGTGKTKLAQAYGRFISNPSTCDKPVTFPITLTKADTNKGFTLNADTFFEAIPPMYREPDGDYKFQIGDVVSTGRITLSPRLSFTEDKENIKNEIVSLKGETDPNDKTRKKGELKLWMKTGGRTEYEKSYEIIPVGSNWTDSRPIIGYMNALTGEYLSTPALDVIEKANASGAPYLLILDEMNLSHVERYFSDILSTMESNEEIRLDDGRSVRIPGNLAVVGTVNMDETTYMFSPKVLDRANVIEFPPASIDGYLGEEDPLEDAFGDVAFLQDPVKGTEVRSMKAREILDGFREGGAEGAAEGIVSGLRSAQASMTRMNLPFGYRTVDEVLRFMHVAWVYEGKGDFANWRRYFDAQIMQKVLPKIHGNSSLRPALEELRAFCEAEGFPRSEAKLARMIGVLDSQRYVSFNC